MSDSALHGARDTERERPTGRSRADAADGTPLRPTPDVGPSRLRSRAREDILGAGIGSWRSSTSIPLRRILPTGSCNSARCRPVFHGRSVGAAPAPFARIRQARSRAPPHTRPIPPLALAPGGRLPSFGYRRARRIGRLRRDRRPNAVRQRPVHATGHVALEAPHHLALRQPLFRAPLDVALRSRICAHASQHDHMQRRVRTPVPAPIQAMPPRLSYVRQGPIFASSLSSAGTASSRRPSAAGRPPRSMTRRTALKGVDGTCRSAKRHSCRATRVHVLGRTAGASEARCTVADVIGRMGRVGIPATFQRGSASSIAFSLGRVPGRRRQPAQYTEEPQFPVNSRLQDRF